MTQEEVILYSVIIAVFVLVIIIFNSFAVIAKKNRLIKELEGQIEKKLSELEKYKPIKDIEERVYNLKVDLDSLKLKMSELRQKYSDRREVFKTLNEKINLYENELELIDFGIYKPIFNFDDSEKYKSAIKINIENQRRLITSKRAAICHTEWSVDGSLKKGQVKTNRSIKLTLRAFNGECDSIISKTKWNNVLKIEERIRRAKKGIDKVNKSTNIEITDKYLELKIEQLRLTYEYELRKYEEKEEQRRIRQQMRDEEIARREIEKAKLEAEKEEIRYLKALEKVQKDVEKATGAKLKKLTTKIAQLEEQLRNAQSEKERAISRAQITKSGHVYIISNIGSFGEQVYKIGMTRRLDPIDRVKELGDASVPFRFDVHAIIYSDNAPELESKLHKAFDSKRVNMINNRKEFFNISLDEIQSVVNDSLDGEFELTKIAEAQEYRETLALLEELENKIHDAEEFMENSFPEDLFED